jgi:hypothetical protein
MIEDWSVEIKMRFTHTRLSGRLQSKFDLCLTQKEFWS